MNPIISIVVPTYNRAHLISKTLESLWNQTYNNYEIIIVDDGSTDNTEEMINPFLSERVSYYKKANAERAAARNYGTQKAKGIYINWFDSDDIALENHIAEAKKMVEIYHASEWFHLNYSFLINSQTVVNKRTDISNNQLVKGNCLSCNGVFVRKDIALADPFNEERILSASEDYELWLRLASKFPIKSSNTVTSTIVQHDERSVLMSNPDKLIQRFEKFIDLTTSNPEVVKFLGRKLAYFKMKNYLILSVDLAANKHKKLAIQYFKKAIFQSLLFVFEKSTYAIVRRLLF